MKDRPEKREVFYEEQPHYFERRELSEMIEGQKDHREIIRFMKKNRLDASIYVPIRYQSIYVPVLYLASLKPGNDRLIDYLLKHGANPNNLPDMSIDKVNEILFVCDTGYLDKLIRHGAEISDKSTQIKTRLKQANLDRLKALKSYGVLSQDDLKNAILDFPDLIGESVRAMVTQIRHNGLMDKPYLDIQDRYLKFYEWILSAGVKTDHKSLQIIVDTYLVNIVKCFLEHGADSKSIEVRHHKVFSRFITAPCRQLYTDSNYRSICELLGQDPIF